MTLIPVGNANYVGLSGDRPTVGIVSGSRFVDVQTGEESFWDGSKYLQVPRSVFSGSQLTGAISGAPEFKGTVNFTNQITLSGLYTVPYPDLAKMVVWVSGGTYRVLNTSNSTIEYSGTNAFDAIKHAQSGAYAFNNSLNPFSGDTEIIIKDGEYIFGSGFTGFNLREKTNFVMAHGARFIVPPFYSGDVFLLTAAPTEHVYIRGGTIYESGTIANINASGRNWTAFHFDVSGSGFYFSRIEDVEIWYAKYGLHIQTGINGWWNSNAIRDITIWYPHTAIRFSSVSGAVPSDSNTFYNVTLQAISGASKAGLDADGLFGSRNTFLDCTMWDLGVTSGAYSAHIGTSGANTIIIGGAMTHFNYYNSGIDTFVLDEWQKMRTDTITAARSLYVDRVRVSGAGLNLVISNDKSGEFHGTWIYGATGANYNDFSLWDSISQNERFIVWKNSAETEIRSQRAAAGGAVRPMAFKLTDSTVPTIIESLRLDVSGNVEMNRSGGTVQFNSGNTSLTRTVTAAMSGAFGPLGFLTVRLGTTSVKVPYFSP